MESIVVPYSKQLENSLDKLKQNLLKVASQCILNEAVSDRSVTQMECQLLALRHEKETLEKELNRVEKENLENDAQYSQSWQKAERLEAQLTEKERETAAVQDRAEKQEQEIKRLKEIINEKANESQELQKTVKSLVEQASGVTELSSWRVQAKSDLHDTVWGGKRLAEELKEANKNLEKLGKEKQELINNKATLTERVSQLETKLELHEEEWKGRERELREELGQERKHTKEQRLLLEEKEQVIEDLQLKLDEARRQFDKLKESTKHEIENLRELYNSYRKSVSSLAVAGYEEDSEVSGAKFGQEYSEQHNEKTNPLKRRRTGEFSTSEETLSHLHTQDLLESILHELEKHAPELEIQKRELERALQHEQELVMKFESVRLEADKLRTSNRYLEEQTVMLQGQLEQVTKKKQEIERRLIHFLREKENTNDQVLDSNVQGLMQHLDILTGEIDEPSSPKVEESTAFLTRYSSPHTVSRKLIDSFKTPGTTATKFPRRQESSRSLKTKRKS
eukprot:jgi/Galph1/5633/GphlegSOOS_G4240.1